MLEREMRSSSQFDRQHVKSEILAISNTGKVLKSYALRRKRNIHARQEEERIRQEQERLIQAGIAAEKAKIWNYLSDFCAEIKSGKRLNGNDRYSSGETVKAWHSFMRLYGCFDKKHQYTWGMVNRKFVAKFLAFMEKEGYMVTAQNKYLGDPSSTYRLCLYGWHT